MTQGIRDFFKHVTMTTLAARLPVGSVRVTEGMIGKSERALVKKAFIEAIRVGENTGDVLRRFGENLVGEKTSWGEPMSPILESGNWELERLVEHFKHPEWRMPEDMNVFKGGIFDHFKGGIYKSRNVAMFANGELYVEYTSMLNGRDFGRFLAEWVELVLWPDGQYRSRFVYRGPDLDAPEPAFKVKKDLSPRES